MAIGSAGPFEGHAGERRRFRVGVPAVLVAVAAAGWWWSVRMAGDMTGDAAGGMGGMGGMSGMAHTMSFGAFVVAWVAMMAAMMFPAISPVVRLYSLAAARGRAAPLPFFVAAYVFVWGALAVPSYFVWRELREPLADSAPWAGRLAAAILIAAAVWQLTPLKSVCLRHCRSPLSFFMQYGGRTSRPLGAFRMGVAHGLFCLGCCWALMAVLVAMGTMNLVWMAVLAGLIFVEKNARRGEQIATAAAVAFAALGVALLLYPQFIGSLT